MSNQDPNPEPTLEPKEPARPLGGTEHSWCKAVPIGTGITVLSILLSKHLNPQLLETALHSLQNYHPALRSILRFNPPTNSFSFLTLPSPNLKLQTFDLQSTAHILSTKNEDSVNAKFHYILEHELNRNSWSEEAEGRGLFFASLYEISGTHCAVVLRLHTAVCDRAAAVAVLMELLLLTSGGEEEEEEIKGKKEEEVSLGIEELIPNGKGNKPFWARGLDVLGYSLNSLRLANLGFVDAASPRRSRVLRLRLGPHHTQSLLQACESRGIKLCGAFAAAGLIAARSTKDIPDEQREKYAVVTLVDCRPILEPALPSHHLGFYHSAIMNSHDVSGDEKLWELAKRCYMSYTNAKKNNKHFTDMGDLNFLMCRAIENPGLTPSSSLRTAFISLFEEPVIGKSNAKQEELGLEDFVGCSSVHGIGPSIAIFDTLRDGQLDCACVYPSPLHSKEQMQKLIDDMKKILVDGSSNIENESESLTPKR